MGYSKLLQNEEDAEAGVQFPIRPTPTFWQQLRQGVKVAILVVLTNAFTGWLLKSHFDHELSRCLPSTSMIQPPSPKRRGLTGCD
jgi:hypothetical protein